MHGDDGFAYSIHVPQQRHEYHRAFEDGDVIGCGYDLDKSEVFFTCNGAHLGVAFTGVDEMLYHATIGMHSDGEKVTLNFGATPFLYQKLLKSSIVSDPTNTMMIDGKPTLSYAYKHPRSPADGDGSVYCNQSTLSLIPKSPELIKLEESVLALVMELRPRSYFHHLERHFGVEEDEAIIALINRRNERDDQSWQCIEHPSTFILTAEEKVSYNILANTHISAFDLKLRLSLLVTLNQLLSFGLPFVNLSRPSKRSLLARHYRDTHIRHLFLNVMKTYHIKKALINTANNHDPYTHSLFALKLDLFKAIKLTQRRLTDHTVSRSLFGQAYQQLVLHRHSELNRYGDLDKDETRWYVHRQGERPWRVIYRGMYGDDYGGPYRDCLNRMCKELQSNTLTLFIPTPNNREQIGLNRSAYVPRPSATSVSELNQYRFVGMLMGLAMRNGELLYLDFPSIVWKFLCEDSVNESDVMAIDALSFKLVTVMKQLEQSITNQSTNSSPQLSSAQSHSVTTDMFAESIDSTFTIIGSDQHIHELIPHGASLQVTWTNRYQFIEALIQYRKHEFRVQLAAIKEGLATIVPASLLCLLTWQQLRTMVCGAPSIDVDMLFSMSSYENCAVTDAHIRSFWSVFRSRFDESQRAMFLQFVNGSSSLPVRVKEWDKRFRIQRLACPEGLDDSYLPVAHTCFFSVELPAYSTDEVMYQRLLYAITHCIAIDADNTEAARQSGRMMGQFDQE